MGFFSKTTAIPKVNTLNDTERFRILEASNKNAQQWYK